MTNQQPFLFAFACALIVAMPLMGCDRSPSRLATGEEIGAAVKNAEAQMAEARAKQSADAGNGAFKPEKALAGRNSDY